MNIKKKKDRDTLYIIISGRIDTATAPQLDTAVRASLNDVSTLILDFQDVKYVSSAGLRVLLSLQKKMMAKGEMKLIHVNEAVNEVFEVTGFDGFLTYETDV